MENESRRTCDQSANIDDLSAMLSSRCKAVIGSSCWSLTGRQSGRLVLRRNCIRIWRLVAGHQPDRAGAHRSFGPVRPRRGLDPRQPAADCAGFTPTRTKLAFHSSSSRSQPSPRTGVHALTGLSVGAQSQRDWLPTARIESHIGSSVGRPFATLSISS